MHAVCHFSCYDMIVSETGMMSLAMERPGHAHVLVMFWDNPINQF